jgi:hypothetical protein
VGIVAEDDPRFLQLAPALDVHRPGAVHEHVRDGRVLHERLDGTEPEGLVLDLDDELLALLAAQRGIIGGQHLLHDATDLLLHCVGGEEVQLRQVDTLDQLAVDTGLELVVGILGARLGLDGNDGTVRLLPERWLSLE